MSRNVEISFQALLTKLKIDLEEEKACRICAAKGVKMYDLHTNPWEHYFEIITGISPLMDISHNVCYQCAALMKKYYLFRQKCLHRQATMYEYNSSIKEVNPVVFDDHSTSFNLSVYNVPDQSIYEYVYGENEHVDIIKEETTINGKLDNSVLLDHDYLSLQSPLDGSMDDDGSAEILNNAINRNSENASPTDRSLDVEVKSTDRIFDMLLMDNSTENCETEEADIKSSSLTQHEMELEKFFRIKYLSVEEQIEEVKERQNSSNYKCSFHKCDLCYRGFNDIVAFQNHMKKHEPTRGEFECPICQLRFPKRGGLQNHAANHDLKFFCKSCDSVVRNVEQAKLHLRWHNGVKYKCYYCKETFTNKTSSLTHVRIKHPSDFVCGCCGYSFVSRLGLAMHQAVKHKDDMETTWEVVRQCEECDVEFTSQKAWKRHLVTSAKHKQSQYSANGCRDCGETFDSRAELRTHHRLEHVVKQPRRHLKKASAAAWPSKCEHCDETLASGYQRRAHHRRHHPDKEYLMPKNYICELCGKGFQKNASLEYHRRDHLGERPYKCKQCPKAFSNTSSLLIHRQAHDDRRPFACDICCKSFKRKSALRKHYLIHTGEKPYKCDICGKAFNQHSTLKLHVRTVHWKLPSYVSKKRPQRRRAPRGVDAAASDRPASADVHCRRGRRRADVTGAE